MTDQYRTTVLEKAERVAEHHDPIVQSADTPFHGYFRYAVPRLLEGKADEMSVDVPQIGSVTVGQGEDDAMFDSWGDDVEWWVDVPAREACTRFRVFYPDEYEAVPRVIVDVMAALGARRVWTGSAAACGSYDHRERREVQYLWPEGHPVEKLLQDRIQSPEAAVAPDGGRNRRRSRSDGRHGALDPARRPRASNRTCRRRRDGRLVARKGWPVRGPIGVRELV